MTQSPLRIVASAVRDLWRHPDDLSTAPLEGLEGESPVEVAELVSALDQLRRDVAAVRRREAGLQRLVQTAHHLLASPAPRELLTIVVEATRDLLRSDVAHLNLEIGDHRFDTIRTTTGVRTEAFRRQRTPAGAGLTGLVMRSRQPYVTPNYLHDDRLEHDPTGDSSVAADGLVTMAAVPMWRGDDVVGVLMASWRREGEVGPEQLALLSSLSSLAGLAVTNTWLRSETDAARADLERANQHIQQTNEMLRRGAEAHDILTGLLHQGASVSQVTNALHELLDAEVALLGEHGDLLESSPGSTGFPAVPHDVRLAAGKVNGRIRELTRLGEDQPVTWAADCRSGQSSTATLLVRRHQPMSEIEQRTIERAATTIALILSTRTALAEAEFRSAAEALADLLRGARVDSASARLRSRGLDPAAPSIIVTAQPTAADRPATLTIARRFAEDHNGLATTFGTHLVLMLPGGEPDKRAHDLATRLDAQEIHAPIGADGPTSAAAQLPTTYRRAMQCLRAVHQLGGNQVGTVASLGFVGLMLGAADRDAVRDYVSSRLGPLLHQPDPRSADLLQTLRSYLRHNGSLRQAATELNVHPNTVLQRLQRAEKLLDVDLQEPDTRAELDLALRTRALLTATQPETPTPDRGYQPPSTSGATTG